MSSVTVFGATGYTGRALVTELLARGHSVIAVARSNPEFRHRNVRVISGSLHTPGVLAEATKGVDAILVAVSAREIDGTRLADAVPALLAAAAEADARLGFMGGAGSLLVSPEGPRLMDTAEFPEVARDEALGHGAILDALLKAEDGVDWFYVSPGLAYGSWNPGSRTGRYRLGQDVLLTDAAGDSDISAADLAIAFVDEIECPAHHRERFTVAN